jgi:predicted transcriptional regulator
MSHTITVRLTKDLAEWLAETARRSGVPMGRIVREALERVRAKSARQSFLRLAGAVRGPRDLSSRKGFARP